MSKDELGKELYEAPRVERLAYVAPLSLLESFSLEGELEDFQDGDDF